MNKFFQKISFISLSFLLSFSNTYAAGLIPCGDRNEPVCDFNQVMELINRVIKFLLFDISIPIAAILFAYAGIILVTSGGSESARTKAKNIFINVAVGLTVALASWLIIETILSTLGYDGKWIGF